MITDEEIRTEFIHSIVNRDITRIYQTQAEVVSQHLKTKTGALKSLLLRRPFEVSAGTYHQLFYMHILPYLRFLDIRYKKDKNYRRNLALYNRIIWGVLYHETLPDLRYGFTKEVREKIRQELEHASPGK